MTERRTRPTDESIKEAYNRVYNSGHNLSRIKDNVLSGRFFASSDNTLGVSGRSITWKLFLISDQPLEPPSAPVPPIESLRSSRKAYRDILLDKLRAPDGSYEDGFIVPGSNASPRRPEKTSGNSEKRNLEKNNPLSLHDENPWTDWFESVELRKTILQDVERTFPDIGYFRDADVQSQLTNILFLYSATHPAVGYRQGMHELLAPLYYAIDYDSVSDDRNAPQEDLMFREMCSRTWVAADAWALFTAVMRAASKWYEWREWHETVKLPAATGASPFTTHVQFNIPDGQVDLKPYVAPIVQACDRVQSKLLKSVDPLLWKQMQAAGIEPQIYGIRWLRLLFTREFTMDDAMVLWDGLFACDPTFELAPWICVAMLIRIRNRLIPSDYSQQLTLLLRYPTPPSTDLEDMPHHAVLLLRQALALQMSPTPAAGASMVTENRNLLNIPVEVSDPPPAPMRRRMRPGERVHPSAGSDSHSGMDGNRITAHARQQSSPQMGLPEMIARGLLDRGESLGINKTLMTAVSELRRNLPELAASLVRTPSTSTASYAAFPLVDERPPEERPPWEPRTRFEMERDIAQMRSRDKLLGESMGWIVDVLLQDEDNAQEPERLKKRKREALESLSYVRDILNSGVIDVEEERLVGEEEYMRRKSIALQGRQASPVDFPEKSQIDVPAPITPMPLPVADGRSKADATKNDQASFPSAGPRLMSKHAFSSGSGSVRIPPSSFTSTGRSSSMPRPPWTYTPSSFSDTTSPVATLPRVPARTSTTLRPQRVSPSPPEYPSSSGGSTNAAQTPREEGRVEHDPLGVLG